MGCRFRDRFLLETRVMTINALQRGKCRKCLLTVRIVTLPPTYVTFSISEPKFQTRLKNAAKSALHTEGVRSMWKTNCLAVCFGTGLFIFKSPSDGITYYW